MPAAGMARIAASRPTRRSWANAVAPRAWSIAVLPRRRSTTSAATNTSEYTASTSSWAPTTPDPAAPSARLASTSARMAGRPVCTLMEGPRPILAPTRPSTPAAAAASEGMFAISRWVKSGSASQDIVAVLTIVRPRRSSRVTNSGPTVVNGPVCFAPSTIRGSPPQTGSAGSSGTTIPTIRTVSRRTGARWELTLMGVPRATPRRSAARWVTTAWTSGWPATGQAPWARCTWRSSSSANANCVDGG